jgi:hypothetical protein
MAAPRSLVRLWEWWKPVARKIGDVQSRIILTVLYFIFFPPLFPMFVVRDPLGGRRPGWQRFEGRAGDLVAARRQ